MTSTLDRTEEISVLEALARLETAPAMGSGGRLPALLRYLVSEELAGRGVRIKAYSIATGPLGRDSDFDPQADSIVRVEMGRLRKALELHYATEGREDPLVISFPKGSYRPALAFRGHAQPTAPAGSEPGLPRILPVLLAFGALMVAGGVLLAIWMFFAHPPRQTMLGAAPTLVLLPVEAEGASAGDPMVSGFQSELAAELSEQPWLTVVLAASEEQGRMAAAARPERTFLARVRYATDGPGYALSVILQKAQDQAVVWRGRYTGPLAQAQSYALVQGLAEAVSRDVGAPAGALVRLVAEDASANKALAEEKFRCLLSARRYWQEFRPEDRQMAETCLARLARAHADFAEGRAVLAKLRVDGARRLAGPEREAALSEAESLLRGAARPEVMTLVAKMALAACRGTVEGVRATARELLARAPNSPDVLGDVGSKLGLAAGDWSEALELESRAAQLNRLPAPWYPMATAAKAELDGDHGRALQALSDTPQRNFPTGLVMLLSAAALAEAPLRAETARTRLKELGIADREAALRIIDGECWAENAKEAFRIGLRKASF